MASGDGNDPRDLSETYHAARDPNRLTRADELPIELAVKRWIDAIVAKRGCTRQQAAAAVRRAIDAAAELEASRG